MKLILRLRVLIPRRDSQPPAEAGLFGAQLEPRRSFGRSLVLSAAVHCLLGAAALQLAEHSRETGWNALLRGYTVEPLRVMAPATLYYSRPAAKNPPRGKAPKASSSPAPPSRRAPVPAPMEGPAIIQPQPQPISAALKVSGVLAWSARVPEPPRRNAGKTIVPGHREEGAVGQIAAPPRLDVPNRELRFADLNIAAAPVVEMPALPVNTGATTPAAIASEEMNATRLNALDAFRRDPANLIILGANSAPRNEAFTVPPGTRLPGGGAPAGADAAAREGSPGAPEGPTRANAPAPARHTKAPAESESAEASGDVRRAVVVPPDAVQTPGLSAGVPPTPPTPPALPPPIRRTNPADGKFDIVIQQSAPSENFAEAGAVLTGRPVYSVYIHVGTAHTWVLQFCLIPEVQQPAAQTPVVYLGKAERVEAPYPLSTAVPAELGAGTRHTLFHGYLGANGKFRQLRPVGEGDLRAQLILPYLHEWEFRPASRDGQPVDVEVLLAVPPAGL